MEVRHWRDCDDPEMMLVWLQNQGYDPTDRKELLLAVACCRTLWDLLPEPQRRAVEVAERLVEGHGAPLTNDEWNELADCVEDHVGFEMFGPVAAESCRAIYASFIDFRIHRVFAGSAAARAWVDLLSSQPQSANERERLVTLANGGPGLLGEAAAQQFAAAFARYQKALCPLVEEVFGHQFHGVALDPAWLLRDGNVLRLAQSISESRDYTAAPILADALEDAGCAEAVLLDHLRDTSIGHVRGCWVLDLILGLR